MVVTMILLMVIRSDMIVMTLCMVVLLLCLTFLFSISHVTEQNLFKPTFENDYLE